jgi:hypothetical protein
MAYSRAMLKSNDDKAYPCFRTLWIGNAPNIFYLCRRNYRFHLYTAYTWISLINGGSGDDDYGDDDDDDDDDDDNNNNNNNNTEQSVQLFKVHRS